MNFVDDTSCFRYLSREWTMCRKSHMSGPAPSYDFRNQIAQALLSTSQRVELVQEQDIHAAYLATAASTQK